VEGRSLALLPLPSRGRSRPDKRIGGGREERFFAPLRMTSKEEGYECGELAGFPRKWSCARSFHVGLADSINAIFLTRSYPLICFSRAIASRMSANLS